MSNQINTQSLEQQLAILMAENAALKAKAGAKSVAGKSMRVSEKGGLSVYGLGRFPITLYKSQWESLLAMHADLVEFIKQNESVLKEKEAKAKA